MPEIDVDNEVICILEQNRLTAGQSHNEILRYVLNIRSEIGSSKGGAWHSSGAILPSGTLFEFTYKGQLYCGEIIDGKWHIENQSFLTPSRMIHTILPATAGGNKAVFNAWLYIRVNRPFSNEWVVLASLRKYYSRRS